MTAVARRGPSVASMRWAVIATSAVTTLVAANTTPNSAIGAPIASR